MKISRTTVQNKAFLTVVGCLLYFPTTYFLLQVTCAKLICFSTEFALPAIRSSY